MKDCAKIFEIICDVSELLTKVIDPNEEGGAYPINFNVSNLIIDSLVELENILDDDIKEIFDSTFLTVAYELSLRFESTIKKIIENGELLQKDVYYFDYLPLVKSLINIILMLDNWLYNPVDGNGISLVKIVPGANWCGMAFFENISNGEVIDLAFCSFNPFYVCTLNRDFTLCVCDFDEKSRTVFKERVNDLGMGVKALLPPFSEDEKYSIISC